MVKRTEAASAQASADLRSHPAVRDYTLVSLAGLLVMAAVLYLDGMSWWVLIPVLVGSGALLMAWAAGPPLVLACLAGLLLERARMWGYLFWSGPSDVPSDLALAGGVLAYVAGHYRLQGLIRQARPIDRRNARRRRNVPESESWFRPAPERRPPSLVGSNEVLVLLIGVPVFALLGYVVWARLALETPSPGLGLNPPEWRAVVLVWLVFLGLAATSAVLGYLRWTQASRDECLMYLQDQLWSATRGEQRRINRWLVWARLRAQRRKEGG
jgi:hypothetical protein